MKYLFIIFCLISGLMAISLSDVVQKGLEKKGEFMDKYEIGLTDQ